MPLVPRSPSTSSPPSSCTAFQNRFVPLLLILLNMPLTVPFPPKLTAFLTPTTQCLAHPCLLPPLQLLLTKISFSLLILLPLPPILIILFLQSPLLADLLLPLPETDSLHKSFNLLPVPPHPEPPPAKGVPTLQPDCVFIIKNLVLLLKNVRILIPGQKPPCEVTAYGSGHILILL